MVQQDQLSFKILLSGHSVPLSSLDKIYGSLSLTVLYVFLKAEFFSRTKDEYNSFHKVFGR